MRIRDFLLNSDGELPVTLQEIQQLKLASDRLPKDRTATGEEILNAIIAEFGDDFPMYRIKKIVDWCNFSIVPKEDEESHGDSTEH